MAMLRVWQHIRLRSDECNVSGVLLRVDAEGVVEDESGLTPEAVKVMATHPNWSQVERDSARVLKERLAHLKARVESTATTLAERESLYRQAYEAYEKAVAEYKEAVAVVGKEPDRPPAPEAPAAPPAPRPKAAPEPKVKRAIPEALRHFFEDPSKVVNEEELRAMATSYGIQTTRKSRAKIESEMKALVAPPEVAQPKNAEEVGEPAEENTP